MEHGSITFESLPQLMQVTEASGCLPFVRVSYPEPSYIRRALDLGARGIVIPMVNTYNIAKTCIDACYYPPKGTRGVGFCSANHYGKHFDSYISTINSKLKIIIQIEHISALEDIDRIMKIPGISTVMIGPYDLSASLNKVAQFDNDEYLLVKNKIFNTAISNRIQAGIHIVNPSIPDLKKHIKEKFTFIAYGMDSVFYQKILDTTIESIQHINRSV